MTFRRCGGRLAVLAAGCQAAAALAQPAPDRRSDSAFKVTPYVWATGFGGTLRPRPVGPDFVVSKSFGELFETIDAAFFVTGLARTGRLVIVGDVSHSASSTEGQVPTPIPGIPLVPAEGALKQTSLTLLGGYRAIDRADLSIDLLAGLRAFWLDVKVAAPALGAAATADADFVDPIIALRTNVRLADGWGVIGYADAGGFGAGSEFTAQLAATVNARVARNVWISGGYRYLMVDYRSVQTRADVHLGGPLLGATVTF